MRLCECTSELPEVMAELNVGLATFICPSCGGVRSTRPIRELPPRDQRIAIDYIMSALDFGLIGGSDEVRSDDIETCDE